MAVTASVKVVFGVALLIGIAYAYTGYELHVVGEDEARYMEPALQPHKLRLFRTDGALPPRGAIVWYAPPGGGTRRLLSRVWLDGEPLAEPYVRGRESHDRLPPVPVPAWHLWVLNDQRAARGSALADSRALGPIPLGRVVGWLAPGAEAGAAP